MRSTLQVTRAFAVAAVLGCAAPAFSEPILITRGFMEVDGRSVVHPSTMSFSGRRFSFEGDGVLGRFDPEPTCSAGCQPGEVIDLFATWIGGDLEGVATLDGVTYVVAGFNASAGVEFTGSLVLPPFSSDTVVIRAPFEFTGSFRGPLEGVDAPVFARLRGSGTVSTTWVREPDLDGGTGWFINLARYEFATPVPEPTTLAMFALGGAVVALRKRRMRNGRLSVR